MKLRIKGDSIRFRLSQKEVSQFSRTGMCNDVIHFPGKRRLAYCIQSYDGEAMNLEFESTIVRVLIPTEVGEIWSNSEQVGMESHVETGDEITTFVLIEKDFTCTIDRPNEDETDNFPNPRDQMDV